MCYNYSIETDNGNEEVVRLIDEKHESTCKYFAELVAIGYTELMKSNIGVEE